MSRRRMMYGKVNKNTLLLLHFDGDVKDSSAYGRAVSGGVTNYVSGKFGQGGRFDTTKILSYSLPSFNTKDFTIECFLKIETAATYATIALNGEDSIRGMLKIDLSANGLIPRFYVNGGDSLLSSNTTLSTGVFYHLAVSRLNGMVRIFINGVLKGQKSMGQNISRTGFTTGDGARFVLDEFRISDICRYDSNFTPPTEPLK